MLQNLIYCDTINTVFGGIDLFRHRIDDERRIVIHFKGFSRKVVAETPEEAYHKLRRELWEQQKTIKADLNKRAAARARQHIRVLDNIEERKELLMDALNRYDTFDEQEKLQQMDPQEFGEWLQALVSDVDGGFFAYHDEMDRWVLQFPEDCQWDEEEGCIMTNLCGTYLKPGEPTVVYISGESGEEMWMNLTDALREYRADDIISARIAFNAREIIAEADKQIELLRMVLKMLNEFDTWYFEDVA